MLRRESEQKSEYSKESTGKGNRRAEKLENCWTKEAPDGFTAEKQQHTSIGNIQVFEKR